MPRSNLPTAPPPPSPPSPSPPHQPETPKPLRFLINLCLMLAVALALGFALSYYSLTDGRLVGAAQFGPWSAWPRAGSPTPDPYTKAYLARTGALQLGQAEGVQLVATADSD